MSVLDIQSYLEKRDDVAVSTGFISTLTDLVLDDMRAWQQRALSERYAVVYLDALVTSSRQNGMVAKRHLYVALGINMQGEKELLGLWGQATEGAKAWMSMLTGLKNRGVNDILIACVDGLKGFEEAINAPIHTRKCNNASSIKCATAYALCRGKRGKRAKPWQQICGRFTVQPLKRQRA